jgi:hypothetical protein
VYCATGLEPVTQGNGTFVTFGYKHIEIASFTRRVPFFIMPAMSIQNVKIDLLSAAALGAFALFALAPLFA